MRALKQRYDWFTDASHNPCLGQIGSSSLFRRLWILPEAEHSNSYLVRPEEYKKRGIAVAGETTQANRMETNAEEQPVKCDRQN